MTVVWTIPVESLMTANTMPPLLRVLYIQPLILTGISSESPDRTCLMDCIQMLKLQTEYKTFGTVGSDLSVKQSYD